MKAIIKTQNGYTLQSILEPEIREPHEIKIRIQSAALCRTDLYVADGNIPVQSGRVLGHEATGVITECGSAVNQFKVGDSVIINPLRSCGQCEDCRKNNQHHCQNTSFMGIDYDGAFAECVVISDTEAHPLPAHLSFAIGAYAEPIAATLAILDTSISKNQTIGIVGTGRIAALAVEILKNNGYSKITPVQFAPSEMRFDCMIESKNDPSTIEVCVQFLKPEGTLIIKSRNPSNLSLPTLSILKKRLRLESAYYADFESAITYLSQYHQQIESHLGNTWKLDQFKDAFSEAASSETQKTYFDLS